MPDSPERNVSAPNRDCSSSRLLERGSSGAGWLGAAQLAQLSPGGGSAVTVRSSSGQWMQDAAVSVLFPSPSGWEATPYDDAGGQTFLLAQDK